MTQAPSEHDGVAPTPIVRRAAPRWMGALVLPAGLTLLASCACYRAVGPTLGLYFGGVVLVTLMLPTVAAQEARWLDLLLAYAGVTLSVVGVWAYSVFHADVSAGECARVSLVLVAYAGALAGLSRLLARAVGPTLAGAVVITLACAWLAWPIWLAPTLTNDGGDRLVAWLTPAHPLLAINGVLADLGTWTEQPIGYQIMNLNQDVPYVMPHSVLWAVAVHAGVAAASLAGTWSVGRRRIRKAPG